MKVRFSGGTVTADTRTGWIATLGENDARLHNEDAYSVVMVTPPIARRWGYDRMWVLSVADGVRRHPTIEKIGYPISGFEAARVNVVRIQEYVAQALDFYGRQPERPLMALVLSEAFQRVVEAADEEKMIPSSTLSVVVLGQTSTVTEYVGMVLGDSPVITSTPHGIRRFVSDNRGVGKDNNYEIGNRAYRDSTYTTPRHFAGTIGPRGFVVLCTDGIIKRGLTPMQLDEGVVWVVAHVKGRADATKLCMLAQSELGSDDDIVAIVWIPDCE